MRGHVANDDAPRASVPRTARDERIAIRRDANNPTLSAKTKRPLWLFVFLLLRLLL